MMKQDKSADENFFLDSDVDRRCRIGIEERFRALLLERGITWANCYNEIGLDKGYASKIRRGLIIPPLYIKIKLAKFFGVDTSVIWSKNEN